MIKIKFGRRSVCMGDDVMNGIYTIQMPDDATLKDLIRVILNGGNGNTWPIPTTSTCWNIYTNIGRIADIVPEKNLVTYNCLEETEPLASLGIKWFFGGHEENDLEISYIERSHF